MPVFKCYVLPSTTVGQPKIFLHNPPFFNTSSAADRSTSLLTSISLDRYITSKRIFSPLDIYTQPQVERQTQGGRLFYQMIWCLGRCAHFKGENAFVKINPGYRMIYMYLHTHPQISIAGPRFTYLPQSKKLLKLIIQYPKM